MDNNIIAGIMFLLIPIVSVVGLIYTYINRDRFIYNNQKTYNYVIGVIFTIIGLLASIYFFWRG